MTKERKIAIQMWEHIRDEIKKENPSVQLDLSFAKREFLSKYNVGWKFDCWFCQYIKECIECPLKNNANKYYAYRYGIACVDYWLANNDTADLRKEFRDSDGNVKKSERIKACNRIIETLKNE